MARACRACGWINEGDTSQPEAACPDCGTRYRIAGAPIGDDESETTGVAAPGNIERTRLLLKRKREKDEHRASFQGAIAVMVLLAGWLLYQALKPNEITTTAPYSPSTPTCNRNDAACLGLNIIGRIQLPCARAIENQLAHLPTWTDGFLENRFDRPAWYMQPDSLIFYGRHLEVTNGFGAKTQPSYYCVTRTDGTVLKAGIPDLE